MDAVAQWWHRRVGVRPLFFSFVQDQRHLSSRRHATKAASVTVRVINRCFLSIDLGSGFHVCRFDSISHHGRLRGSSKSRHQQVKASVAIQGHRALSSG
jgi:hypothetical protein